MGRERWGILAILVMALLISLADASKLRIPELLSISFPTPPSYNYANKVGGRDTKTYSISPLSHEADHDHAVRVYGENTFSPSPPNEMAAMKLGGCNADCGCNEGCGYNVGWGGGGGGGGGGFGGGGGGGGGLGGGGGGGGGLGGGGGGGGGFGGGGGGGGGGSFLPPIKEFPSPKFPIPWWKPPVPGFDCPPGYANVAKDSHTKKDVSQITQTNALAGQEMNAKYDNNNNQIRVRAMAPQSI